MARLIFFVARAGMIDVGEAVESEFAVSRETRLGELAVDFPVGFVADVCAQGIDEAASASNLLKCSVDEAGKLAVREALMEVADFPQFFFDVAIFDFGLEGSERFGGCISGFERFESGFGREHSTLYREVNTF